jgi:hypothetical protein
MAEEATARQLRPVEAESARYFVRGYLSASSSEAGGTSFTYVWDVFDAGYRRIQRLEDQISIAKRASDPWSLADDAVLASLASKSADDLAALVATLPEALAAAAPTSPIRSAALIQ